jgi:MFS family permease
MSGFEFQAALSVFYVGIILFGVPSNMLLNHFGRPSLHIGLAVLFWGTATSCTAAVNNFGGIMACRTILGIAGEFWSNSTSRSTANLRQRLLYMREFYSTSQYVGL